MSEYMPRSAAWSKGAYRNLARAAQ